MTDRRLPNAHLAVVDRYKVVDYLLNASHPDNGGKARFFETLGFARGTPEPLMLALQGLATNGALVESVESPHGQKHVVEGRLPGHTGGNSRLVRSVWIVDRGQDVPRLVTAYPGRE